MVVKKTVGEKIFDFLNVIFMVLVIMVTLYPMYYVLVCSISDGAQLMSARGAILWPKGFSMSAYKAVAENPNIFTGYRTTLIVVVVGTTLSVFLTAIGAFVITRKRFPLAMPLAYLMVFTMYFGGGMIPTYLVVNNLYKMQNSLLALIIPHTITVYNLMVMKSNFQAIPDSLEEAAKIDGATDFRVFFQIILPLSKSIIAVMVLYYGVSYWNSWFDAMMYLRDRRKYPLQLILREILISNSGAASMADGGGAADSTHYIAQSIKYATIMVSTLPILCLYPFIQKYFTKGIMIGAVKG